MPDSLEQALSQIDRWPAPHVGVAVVTPAGVVARHGQVDAPAPWASVSKLLTAYAVLMAAQDEEFDLDEPGGPDGSTIRHLLAHASGLPFEGQAAVARPGTRRIYSNTGFDLLGEIISATTGHEFNEYLTLQVVEPLELTAEIVGRPSAGLSGSVLDLAAFARELLAPTLLEEPRLSEATSVAFPGLAGIIPGIGRYDPCDWSLGFEIRNGKAPHWTGTMNSPATFGHFGGSGSFMWVDPPRQVAMCGLTGRQFDDDGWAMQWWPPFFDAVLGVIGPLEFAP